LLHSEAPLAEVGFLCGFSDQAHFTRAFKRQVGLTPARYRTEFADTA
jgi:AraC-like DNA-binding protein